MLQNPYARDYPRNTEHEAGIHSGHSHQFLGHREKTSEPRGNLYEHHRGKMELRMKLENMELGGATNSKYSVYSIHILGLLIVTVKS